MNIPLSRAGVDWYKSPAIVLIFSRAVEPGMISTFLSEGVFNRDVEDFFYYPTKGWESLDFILYIVNYSEIRERNWVIIILLENIYNTGKSSWRICLIRTQNRSEYEQVFQILDESFFIRHPVLILFNLFTAENSTPPHRSYSWN